MSVLSKHPIGRKGEYKQSLKTLLPYGMLATKNWLMSQGLSTHSLDNAVKTEVLFSLARGVYSQYSRNLSWEGVIASLQRMTSKTGEDQTPPVLVGGLTALNISGMAHYLSLNSTPHIHLYARDKLPSWLHRIPLPIEFEAHRTTSIWPEDLSRDKNFIKEYTWDRNLPPVYFSCPEKAIIEALVDMENSMSFEHADELMQGLVTLSPTRLDQLLKHCKHIKAKRVFLWLAKRQNYQWFSKLGIDNYDLGSGKRVIAEGGQLDKDFLITVPSHLISEPFY